MSKAYTIFRGPIFTLERNPIKEGKPIKERKPRKCYEKVGFRKQATKTDLGRSLEGASGCPAHCD